MKIVLSIAATLTATAVMAAPAWAADYSKEITNLTHFDLVDFVGWNNSDWDVMRTYHGGDVAVDMAGQHTDGVDPHVEALKQTIAAYPVKIVQHLPKVAEGDWTCVVGVTNQEGFSMATVAKWLDGAISEEHLFMRPLKSDEIAALDLTAASVDATTPDDAQLRAATGAGAGWNCAVVGSSVVFTQTVDGAVAQQIGYAAQ